MFDLTCKTAKTINIKSNGLIVKRMTYGGEYLVVVDPYDIYVKNYTYLIKIDEEPLLSNNTIFLRDTIKTEDIINYVPVFGRLLNVFYYPDRTILHIKLSITKDSKSKISRCEDAWAEKCDMVPIDTTKLKSENFVMDKIFRNELLKKHQKLTKEERNRTVPFNIISQSQDVVIMPFKSLDISSPASDISELVTSLDNCHSTVDNKLKVSVIGDEPIIDISEESDSGNMNNTDGGAVATDLSELVECDGELCEHAKKKFHDAIINGITRALNNIDFSLFTNEELKQIIKDIDCSTAEKMSNMIGSEFDMSREDILEAIAETKAAERTAEAVDTVTKVADTGTTIKETTTTVTETTLTE